MNDSEGNKYLINYNLYYKPQSLQKGFFKMNYIDERPRRYLNEDGNTFEYYYKYYISLRFYLSRSGELDSNYMF